VEGASRPREVPRRRPQTGRETNPRSPSRDPASAKLLAVSRKRLRRCGQHALVSCDELPPQICAEGDLFRCRVHRILQAQVWLILRLQGMVRMYSTALAEACISGRLIPDVWFPDSVGAAQGVRINSRYVKRLPLRASADVVPSTLLAIARLDESARDSGKIWPPQHLHYDHSN
jgi:hypothetical protein